MDEVLAGTLVAIMIIIVMVCILFGANDTQAIRETELDRQLGNTRIVIVQEDR